MSKKDMIELGLLQVDPVFEQVAVRRGLCFERRAGPGIGRALRFKKGCERAVFLELKKRWEESDETNPEVILSYAARAQAEGGGFPVYVCLKVFFEGTLRDLAVEPRRLDRLLESAASEVAALTEEHVRLHGKRYTGE